MAENSSVPAGLVTHPFQLTMMPKRKKICAACWKRKHVGPGAECAVCLFFLGLPEAWRKYVENGYEEPPPAKTQMLAKSVAARAS